MIYETRLTIPHNTPETSPLTVTLPLHPGVVNQFDLYFPPGCVGLVHARVFTWARQIFPSNPDSDFSGNDMLIHFPEQMELVDPPFAFVLLGWNLDDKFEHTVTLRVGITPFDKTLAYLFGALRTGALGAITYVE
jgi:hypothetical protein